MLSLSYTQTNRLYIGAGIHGQVLAMGMNDRRLPVLGMMARQMSDQRVGNMRFLKKIPLTVVCGGA